MSFYRFIGVCFVWFWVCVDGALGQGWTSQDVGSVGVSGSTSEVAGTFSVVGSGSDFGGTGDSFRFVYQQLSGDGVVVARVVSVPTNNAWSKAGVVVRESLNSTAKCGVLVVTRDNGVQFLVRKSTAGTVVSDAVVSGRAAPQWVKLIRSGTNVWAYTSRDNVTWELVGCDSVSMASTVYVGLGVASRVNTALGTGVFDNVSVVSGALSDLSAPTAPVLSLGVRSESSLVLGWGGAVDDVGVSGYEVVRDGVVVATVSAGTYSYVDNGLTPSTSYSYTVRALDASGKVSPGSNVVCGMTNVAGTGVFGGAQDVGSVALAGTTSFVSGTFTLMASGNDIWSTADGFRFGYQLCSGDTEVVARVGSFLTGAGRAGVMIREGLNGNAAEASVLVTYPNSVMFFSRGSTGAVTSAKGDTIVGRTPPQWVKLLRHGNVFMGYTSVDGVSWQYVGGDTIAMASSAYAGVAATGLSTTMLRGMTFSNVDISAPQDAGVPTAPSGFSIYSLSDVSLSVSWVPSNDDIGVQGYDVYMDGVQVGTTPFSRFTGTFLTPGSSHNYTVEAFDAAGNLGITSGSFSVTLNTAALPDPWLHNDLGKIDVAGSASFSSGAFGVWGAGADIYDVQDGFHYVYQPLNGNGTIVARVTAIPNPPSTAGKVGVMIRETLEANARNAAVLVRTGSSVMMQWRPTPGATTSYSWGNLGAKAPYWVKLVRGGNTFVGYQSADGATWSSVGTCSVAMGTNAFVGLAVSSHVSGTLALGSFDSVQIVVDSDNNGLPDWWEVTYFGQIGVDPNALAVRGDELTNLQAYQQGLNPVDYYNNVAPVVTRISGDNQSGIPNTLLVQPLVVKLTGSDGSVLMNAPVTVSVTQGGGLVLSSTSATQGTSSLSLRSDTNGLVSAYYQEGSVSGTTSKIKFTAGKGSYTFTATSSLQAGRWSFNSHTGSTTPDGSNTGNIGNAVGGVTWGTGFDGTGAIALDGSTGYVAVAANPTLAVGSGPLSFTAWVCLPQGLALDNESQIYPVATFSDGSVDALSLCVRGGGHGLEARVNTASGVVQVDAGSVPADGKWHQVGVIYDGSGNLSLALDGQLVGTQSGVQIATVASPVLWLGRDTVGDFLKGSIDEVELRKDLLAAAGVLSRYKVDGNSDGMADYWEWRYFGKLSVTGTADQDGDGVSNLQEYQNGTDPTDFYNGSTPVLTKVSGDNQNGTPGLFNPQPLTVLVSSSTGTPIPNATVIFSVQSSGGMLATGTAASGTTALSVKTDANGFASAYYKEGNSFGSVSQIQVWAGASTCFFTESDRFGAVPEEWIDTDIGTVVSGSAGYDVNTGMYGVFGAGTDIFNAQDGFNFLYQPLNGNATIVARVASTPNPLSTAGKAGLMIRETLDANARNAAMLVRTGTSSLFQYRNTAGATTYYSWGDMAAKAPYWIKLVRAGNVFVGYQSADGAAWTLVGTGTVSMPANAYIGLAMTSHVSGTIGLGIFDSVQIVSDSDNNGLPDWWEVTYFGRLGVDPNALAARGDGLTNLQAYQQGLNPIDYYNNVAPVVTKISGDNQNGIPNVVLTQPLVVKLTGSDGSLLVNAPVTVSITQGGGTVMTSASGSEVTSMALRSDANGLVSFYYQEGSASGATNKIKVTAGKGSYTFTTTTFPQVGWWTFNSHTENTVPDGSTSANAGTVAGGVTWVIKGFDGRTNLVLDGSTGSMSVPATTSFGLGAIPLTLTAWVNVAQNLPLDNEGLIYPIATIGDGTVDGLALSVRGGGHGLEARINTDAGVVQLDTPFPADGFWHQVGLIYDGVGNVSLTLDGNVVVTQTGIQMTAVAAPLLWLGKDSAGHYFNGGIDEVELRREAITAATLLGKYNVDSNSDTMADWWEYKYFGTLGVSGTADLDGDGITNIQEYQNGTSPADFYNGGTPVLTKLSGDNQKGNPSTFLAQVFTVSVADNNGTLLANAPVTFTVQSGGGVVSTATSGASLVTTLTVRTNSNGQASVFYKEGTTIGAASQIQVSAGNANCVFTENDRYQTLPLPWKPENIYGTVTPGMAGYDADSGTFMLSGSGAGLKSSTDSYSYLHRTWYGDGSFLVRVTNLSYPSATSQAGIVLRESTAPNAATINFYTAPNNYIFLTARAATGGTTATIGAATFTPPVWLKLERAGNLILGYASSDKMTWRLVGSTHQTMNTQAEIGLACASGTTSSILPKFDNLALTGVDSNGNGLPDAWEVALFGNLDQTADGDPDNDGLTNWQEFLYGTNPLNANSVRADMNDALAVAQNGVTPVASQIATVGKPGVLERDVWLNLTGTNVNDLTKSAAFNGTPDVREYVTSAATPVNYAENYGQRLRGTITAPVSGVYTFWISAEDSSVLLLGTNESRFSKRKIATPHSSTSPQNWDADPAQKSLVVWLVAGQKYWIEALAKKGSGSDHLDIAWQYPGQTRQIIPGEFLNAPVADPNDTNDNNLPDDWEQAHNLATGEYGDPDNDGFTNFEEYHYGTDPNLPSTAVTGYLSRDVWYGAGDGDHAIPYPLPTKCLQTPDFHDLIPGASETRPTYDWNENFLQRFRGTITAPLSGQYTFWISSDDGSELWLSTNDRKFQKQRIAYNPGCTGNQAFDTSASQKSQPITLQAGQKYYIEILHKEKDAGRHIEVGWQVPGGQREIIPAQNLASFVADPDDQDDDDLPDSWERQYGLDPTDNGLTNPLQASYADYDGDGLSNRQEYLLGTDPTKVDTDGDGMSDGDEIAMSTNPLCNDSSAFKTVQTISGSAFISTVGQWMTSGSGVLDVDRNGSIDYRFIVPTDGIWAFQVDAQPVGVVSGLTVTIPLDVIIDGVFLGRFTLSSYDGASVKISGLTQQLKAGLHTLRIVNRNGSGTFNLKINTVNILQPQGVDQDGNGVADWVDQQVKTNDVATVPAISYTSPACIEGKTRVAGQIQLVSGTNTITAQDGINSQWYADVPLNPDGTSTTIVADFEGGQISSTSTVVWSALNIASNDGSTMAIRKGDSLRLTAFQPGIQPSGEVTITVTSGTSTIDTNTTTADVPVVYTFAQNGTYTVQATWGDSTTSTMTIEVKEASFGDPYVAYLSAWTTWTLSNVGADLSLDWDSNLSVTENIAPVSGGRSFQVLPLQSGAKYVVARLNAGGPILARGTVHGALTYNATLTGDTYRVSTYSNGDSLVRSTIVIDELPVGGYAEVEIVVAGVTFLDGTTVKRLYASDFDQFGVAILQFNYPAGTPTSVCHRINIYDAQGNLVGGI